MDGPIKYEVHGKVAAMRSDSSFTRFARVFDRPTADFNSTASPFVFFHVHKGKLSEKEAREYFQQLIDAIAYCHGKENLLLDSEGKLKVSDFGLSASPQQGVELLYTTCETPNYIAPEVLSNNGYDGAASDIWSCGVILLYIILLIYVFIVNAAEFSYPFWFPVNAKSLIDRILDPNPETRIGIDGIREHPWFQINYTSISHGEDADVSLDDVRAVFDGIEDEFVTEQSEEKTGPLLMNAFRNDHSISRPKPICFIRQTSEMSNTIQPVLSFHIMIGSRKARNTFCFPQTS
ncbi:hypothetical protein L1887_38279 [Cichorium endivia]|nr:hypothetical protein L1887_38279 [Cichorium endivia]